MSSPKSILLMISILLITGTFSCKKNHKPYLKKEVFSKALQEMLVIQNLRIKEPEKALLINGVLKKYHITRKEFERTKHHYAQNPQFWEDVFKTIRERLNQKNSQSQKHRAKRSRK